MDVCFGSYIGAMLIFLGPYYIYYIYYNRIRDLFDDPMYIVFKDIFIFRCVFWANQGGMGFWSRL